MTTSLTQQDHDRFDRLYNEYCNDPSVKLLAQLRDEEITPHEYYLQASYAIEDRVNDGLEPDPDALFVVNYYEAKHQ